MYFKLFSNQSGSHSLRNILSLCFNIFPLMIQFQYILSCCEQLCGKLDQNQSGSVHPHIRRIETLFFEKSYRKQANVCSKITWVPRARLWTRGLGNTFSKTPGTFHSCLGPLCASLTTRLALESVTSRPSTKKSAKRHLMRNDVQINLSSATSFCFLS